jgi:GNAT superfamily N-acetyltransferase
LSLIGSATRSPTSGKSRGTRRDATGNRLYDCGSAVDGRAVERQAVCVNTRPSAILRRAAAGEAVAVGDLWLRSRYASVPAIPQPLHSDDGVREWFARVVLATREVWLAEVGEQVVALMVLDGDWIDQLYVDPEWFGRGLGSQLVELAKELRPSGLDLWTFQSNKRARRFYERHGFRPQETTDGENEEGAADVRYRWPSA